MPILQQNCPIMPRPAATDAAAFYQYYISLTTETEALQALHNQHTEIEGLFSDVSPALLQHAYAPGKWTLAQLLQHVMDTERIFSCRALWFARGSNDPFPGFDENAFAANAPATHRSHTALRQEFICLRASTLHLFESFTASDWQRGGIASGSFVTVNALAFIIAGHFRHHLKIIRERYL